MSKGISRRRFLALAAGSAFIPYGYFETNDLLVTRHALAFDNLPASFAGLTICHITDLHSREFGRDQKDLLELVRQGEPDIIVMTGDMVSLYSREELAFMTLCRHLPDIATTYFVTGNHDMSSNHEGISERVARQRILVMDNRNITLERGEERIHLAGVGDWSSYGEAGLDMALQGIPKDEFSLLLSHHPEQMADFVRNRVNLVLAGHTHGGQIKFPFVGGILAPDQGLFPRYMEGLYQEGETTMFISRGMGESTIPLRLNCPSELVFLTLKQS